LINPRVDASVVQVVQVVRWQGARREGRLGAFRASATPPACRMGGADAAQVLINTA
jgi:hypothetical protein